MTTLPALSTPCTWNTFLARSTPMVLTCIWTTPSGDSLFNDYPLAHSMPGAGVVHHIKGGGRADVPNPRLRADSVEKGSSNPDVLAPGPIRPNGRTCRYAGLRDCIGI